MSFRSALAVLCVAVLLAPAAWGQAPTMSVRVPFAYVNSESPLFLRIDVTNPGPATTARLVARSERDQEHGWTEVYLPEGSTRRADMLVDPQWSFGFTPSTVDLEVAGRKVASQKVGLDYLGNSPQQVGVLSPVGGFEYLASHLYQDTTFTDLSPDDLPLWWTGLGQVRLLVVHDPGGLSLSSRTVECLLEWVYEGGQLLVVTGLRAGELDGSPLAAMAGFRPGRVAAVADLPMMEGEVDQDRVLLKHEGVPLLVGGRLGRGRVTYLASEALELGVLGADASGKVVEQAFPDQSTPDGPPRYKPSLEELGPFRFATSQYFLWSYLLLAVPLNLWVLKRAGRRDLLLATVPLVALLFSVGALAVGFLSRGVTTQAVEASVVRVVSGQRLAGSEGSLVLYSPLGGTFQLEAPVEALLGSERPGTRGLLLLPDGHRQEIRGLEVADRSGRWVGSRRPLWLDEPIRAKGRWDKEKMVMVAEVDNGSGWVLEECRFLVGPQRVTTPFRLGAGHQRVELEVDNEPTFSSQQQALVWEALPSTVKDPAPVMFGWTEGSPLGLELVQEVKWQRSNLVVVEVLAP